MADKRVEINDAIYSAINIVVVEVQLTVFYS